MELQQPKEPGTSKTEVDPWSLLREAWANLVSDYPGSRPPIDPNYELEYYTGTALIAAEFTASTLKLAAPQCDLEQLRQRVDAQMSSLQKKLCVVYYALQVLLTERRGR